MIIASAPIAHPQNTGLRPPSRFGINPGINETMVPPINANPTNSNILDIKIIKQINDLMIWYYHEQIPPGDLMLYVNRDPYCICQSN